jgi:hypothetical protein
LFDNHLLAIRVLKLSDFGESRLVDEASGFVTATAARGTMFVFDSIFLKSIGFFYKFD